MTPSPILPTIKTRGRSTGTTFTTASVTPGANKLQLLYVWSQAAVAPNAPTVTGNGLTWVQVATIVFGTTRRLTLFRALGASPSAGTISIAFAGQSQTAGLWRLTEFAGVDTSGTNGSGAIGGSNTGSGASGQGASIDSGTPSDGNAQLSSAVVHLAAEQTTPNFVPELTDWISGDAAGMIEQWGGDGWTDSISCGWGTSSAWGGIAVWLVPNVLLGSGPSDWPRIFLEFSESKPWDPIQIWHDVVDDLRQFSVGYGRSFELDRFETGQQSYTLDNSSGDYRISNTSGQWFGKFKVMRRMRFGYVWNGLRTVKAEGFVQQVVPTRSNDWGEVRVACVDALEVLARRDMTPGTAVLTTAFGSNADLRYTARGSSGSVDGSLLGVQYGGGLMAPGGAGEGITIEYASGGSNPPIDPADVDVTGNAIRVTLQQPTGQAQNIMNAINANGPASRLVSVTLAPGSNGSGFAGTMSPTPLVGGFPQQAAGARVVAVLESIGFPGWMRDINAGTRTIQAMSFNASDHAKALGHLQDIGMTELGAVFINAIGRLVFQDANARAGASVQGTFTDDPVTDAGALEYAAVVPGDDTALLFNNIVVSRQNGATATATDTQAQLDEYLQRDYSLTTILSSDAQLSTIASALLAKYKDPKTRYQAIVLEPIAGDGVWDKISFLEISSKITVKEHPPGSSAQSIDCFIEHVQHEGDASADPYKWRTTWQLSPA